MSELRIDCIVIPPIATNCYIVGDDYEVMIIDPASKGELKTITHAIGTRHVKYIINTHGHFDHIGADDALRDIYQAPLCIHEDDAPMLTSANENLSVFLGQGESFESADMILHEGDTLTIGGVKFEVMHTPGHSPGSICLYTEGVLFSGDTIFRYGVGRTDFKGGDSRLLYNSIEEKIFNLPSKTLVYPGHEEDGFELGERKKLGSF